MMGELIKLRGMYEQSESGRTSEINQRIEEATDHLVYEIENLTSELNSAKSELANKESEFSQAKTKRETIIKDLKRENGNITEQFIAANSERNRLKSEIDRLREELRKGQSFSQTHSQKLKELSEQKEQAERELQLAREQIKQISNIEEELNDIKTKKLPEKEKVVCS